MDSQKFNNLVEHRFEVCRELLGVKNAEYARGGDKLYNFKVAADFDRDRNETPERSLYGMAKKHLVSIKTIIDDLDSGIVVTPQKASEKISDAINYFILLEALLEERWVATCAREFENIKERINDQAGFIPGGGK